jgi:hypothetical protein
MSVMLVLITVPVVILGQEHATLVKHHSHSLLPTTHASASPPSIYHQMAYARIVPQTALLVLTRLARAQVAALHSV